MTMTDPAWDPFDDGPRHVAEAAIIADSAADLPADGLTEAIEVACAAFGRQVKVEAGADDRTWLVHLTDNELDRLEEDGYLEPSTETQHVLIELP